MGQDEPENERSQREAAAEAPDKSPAQESGKDFQKPGEGIFGVDERLDKNCGKAHLPEQFPGFEKRAGHAVKAVGFRKKEKDTLRQVSESLEKFKKVALFLQVEKVPAVL
jgi:hypothetical protein